MWHRSGCCTCQQVRCRGSKQTALLRTLCLAEFGIAYHRHSVVYAVASVTVWAAELAASSSHLTIKLSGLLKHAGDSLVSLAAKPVLTHFCSCTAVPMQPG
jgi:hypothetical protein